MVNQVSTQMADCEIVLTLLCGVGHIRSDKLDNPIRYGYTLLDSQDPIHHIDESRIEGLFPDELGPFWCDLRDGRALFLDLT